MVLLEVLIQSNLEKIVLFVINLSQELLWELTTRDGGSWTMGTLRTRKVVNAAGAWADDVATLSPERGRAAAGSTTTYYRITDDRIGAHPEP